MNNEHEIGTVRSILRSELTWTVFVIAAIWGFVTSVVLPLQRLQIQLSQIQSDLQVSRDAYVKIETRLGKLEIDHARFLK